METVKNEDNENDITVVNTNEYKAKNSHKKHGHPSDIDGSYLLGSFSHHRKVIGDDSDNVIGKEYLKDTGKFGKTPSDID